MKRIYCCIPAFARLSVFVAILAIAAAAKTTDLTRWVNPFIGTGAHGHTFPGATRPFGMVQLSPDTRIDNWDGSSGYHYSDDIIYGFSHLHLSGTGIPDGTDVLLMPTVGRWYLYAREGERTTNGDASKFSHANEKAEPGYYSVRLDDDDVLAELTSTTRVGLHRYTFPRTEYAFLSLNLKWRDKLLGSQIRLVGDRRIEGTRRSSSWAKTQTVHFVIEFSKHHTAAITNGFIVDGEDISDKKAAFRFDTTDGQPLLIKVAISHVSIEGARKNLEAELPHWDFDKVRAEAKEEWNKELGKIEVSGGTDEQTTNFYTALYHTMIHPNVFNDVDGKYRGHDGKVHQLPGYLQKPAREQGRNDKRPYIVLPNGQAAASEQYTVFSLWDTFRAAHPLYTIIDERRTVDFINTFIRQYEQGGRLPVWELWGEETDTMIGYHAVSVIADAMAKGIKGFDYEKAYAAAKHSAELDHFGLAGYKKRGYISSEDENESVSKTLEYAYNDWCIAQMAEILHKTDDTFYYQKQAEYFLRRSRYFENLFDPSTGFFRPKKNGGFIRPFAPNEVTFHFTEGNSWQYSFFVPHDISRLIELMGGQEKFAAKLDELFTTDEKLAGRHQPDITGLIGQYAHGNEPSHHAAYLFNYAEKPWKTQMYVRRIMDEFYKNTPEGLIGNEDAGQMSAWYVLSASGFYPVSPGTPTYAIGTPLFPQTIYRLENGKSFTIIAKDLSDKNFYVKSVTLNGKPHKKAFLTHQEIARGGTLEFLMTDTPVIDAFTEFPETTINIRTVAVPRIEGPRVFSDIPTIFIRSLTPNTKVFYTTDGSEPGPRSTEYTQPFKIENSRTIKAVAIDNRGISSHVVDAFFLKRKNDWTVTVPSGYSTQYTGGGDNAIVDGIRGTINFSSGEWQGVQGKPYEAVVDLGSQTLVSEVGGGFLQSVGSWIWMPQRIEIAASNDGVNFNVIADLEPKFPLQTPDKAVRDFTQKITPIKTRYIRIKAFNFGKIPQWHLGAGGDPWIFIDEIIVR